MSVGAAVPVLAVVVASRGGPTLARCLASLAWAAERVIVDPADRLGAEPLPPDVRRAPAGLELGALGTAPWVLLVGEDEVVSPSLAAAIATSVTRSSGPRRIRRDVTALGAELRMPGGLVRLAPRADSRLRLRGDLELEILCGGRAGAPERIDDALQVERAASLASAVAALDPDTSGLAVLLEAVGVRPRLRHAVWAGCRAAAVVLGAGMRGGSWQVRWTAAVLAGYRAVVAHAKLWERGRSRPVVLQMRPEDA